eukprot:89249-Chlamydomonas_euryale.AAC.3
MCSTLRRSSCRSWAASRRCSRSVRATPPIDAQPTPAHTDEGAHGCELPMQPLSAGHTMQRSSAGVCTLQPEGVRGMRTRRPHRLGAFSRSLCRGVLSGLLPRESLSGRTPWTPPRQSACDKLERASKTCAPC